MHSICATLTERPLPRRSSRIADQRRRFADQNSNNTKEIAIAVCNVDALTFELVQNIAYHCLGASQLRALECVCTAWFTSVCSANSAWQRVALKRFPRLCSIVQQSSAFRRVPYRELYRRQVVAELGTQNAMTESLNSFLCTVELMAVDQVRVTPSPMAIVDEVHLCVCHRIRGNASSYVRQPSHSSTTMTTISYRQRKHGRRRRNISLEAKKMRTASHSQVCLNSLKMASSFVFRPMTGHAESSSYLKYI